MTETEKLDKPKRSRKSAEAGRANLIKFRETNERPAQKAGLYTVTRSGGQEMPTIPGADEIKSRVDGRIAQFIQDLGGQESITAGQQIVLDGIRTCLLVQGLCENYLSESGLVDKRRRPHGLLKTLATYVNSARLGALSLGVERRPRNVTTLESRLREIAEREGEETDSNEQENIQAPKED